MDGSLAFWCDVASNQVVELEPRIDLHLNLWIELGKGIPGVFDVGILLKEFRQIERLNIYLPARVPLDAVQDLSDTLRDNTTLSAVFNSTLFVGDERRHSFDVRNTDDQVEFRIVRIDFEDDVEVQTLNPGRGTIIRFTKKLFDDINRHEGRHYIRFRLKLLNDLEFLFQSSSNPLDSGVLSGFHRSDVIEMRVNEHRNLNDTLREVNLKYPIIETIQYFLVRDIKTELTQQHAEFRKLRRLEARLWNNYLKEVGRIYPDNCIIYQWKAGGLHRQSREFYCSRFLSESSLSCHTIYRRYSSSRCFGRVNTLPADFFVYTLEISRTGRFIRNTGRYRRSVGTLFRADLVVLSRPQSCARAR